MTGGLERVSGTSTGSTNSRFQRALSKFSTKSSRSSMETENSDRLSRSSSVELPPDYQTSLARSNDEREKTSVKELSSRFGKADEELRKVWSELSPASEAFQSKVARKQATMDDALGRVDQRLAYIRLRIKCALYERWLADPMKELKGIHRDAARARAAREDASGHVVTPKQLAQVEDMQRQIALVRSERAGLERHQSRILEGSAALDDRHVADDINLDAREDAVLAQAKALGGVHGAKPDAAEDYFVERRAFDHQVALAELLPRTTPADKAHLMAELDRLEAAGATLDAKHAALSADADLLRRLEALRSS